MIRSIFTASVLGLTLAVASVPAGAQTPSAPPPAYGGPITAADATRVALAAIEQAKKDGLAMSVAIVDPSGNLIYFQRMDDCQFGSGPVAIEKARSAALFKRPTQAFADGVAHGATYLLGLTGAVPVPGGIPLYIDGKIVGAIGSSGGTGPQDAGISQAGATSMHP